LCAERDLNEKTVRADNGHKQSGKRAV
jgi:hypothetical protein